MADLMGIPKEMKFGVRIPIGWPQNDFVKVKRIKTKSAVLEATGKKTPKRPRASAQGARSSTEPAAIPLLEFDAGRVAIIEPSRVIKPIAIPVHCVLCFFRR